jgi:hypothetical protein
MDDKQQAAKNAEWDRHNEALRKREVAEMMAADVAEAAFHAALAANAAEMSEYVESMAQQDTIISAYRLEAAEIERLRAFHNAWVNAEVSHATGNPELVKNLRAELIAAHKAIRAQQPSPAAAPESCPHCIDERDCANAPICAAVASVSAPPGWVMQEVAAERRRQIEQEGWTASHDDGEHPGSELATAAACYAAPEAISWTDNYGRALDQDGKPRPMSDGERKRSWSYDRALRWPWSKDWWKPKNRRRDLIRAAALIVAEIERLDRAMIASAAGGTGEAE